MIGDGDFVGEDGSIGACGIPHVPVCIVRLRIRSGILAPVP